MLKSNGDMKFWREFIEIYRENPCLWDTSCADYNNQSKKNLAYGILIEKLWDIDESADLDAVKKKITSFRGTARKEASKARKNKSYKSKWHFLPMLSFLPSDVEDKEDEIVDIESVSLDANEIADDMDGTEPSRSNVNTISEDLDTKRPKKKRKLTPAHIEIISPTNIVQEVEDTDDSEDDSETFASQVKIRMRAFDPQQKCIAQKLISDIMFLAETKQLQLTSRVVNRAPQVVSSPNSDNTRN